MRIGLSLQSAINNPQSAIFKSGRVDLNHRPPGPEPGALTGLRYAPQLLALKVLRKVEAEETEGKGTNPCAPL